MTAAPDILALLHAAHARAIAAGVFGQVRIEGARLVCEAKESAAPAQYRIDADGAGLWVSLTTADRWLSQSIEADLVHTGDKLGDLIAEELVDLGYNGPAPGFQHYRSDDKLFTFRSAIPVAMDAARRGDAAAVHTATTCLLAYEACFRNLGDMQAGEDE